MKLFLRSSLVLDLHTTKSMGGPMHYALMAMVGLLLLSNLGGCAQPTLTRAETENRIDSEYRFDDEYNLE